MQFKLKGLKRPTSRSQKAVVNAYPSSKPREELTWVLFSAPCCLTLWVIFFLASHGVSYLHSPSSFLLLVGVQPGRFLPLQESFRPFEENSCYFCLSGPLLLWTTSRVHVQTELLSFCGWSIHLRGALYSLSTLTTGRTSPRAPNQLP